MLMAAEWTEGFLTGVLRTHCGSFISLAMPTLLSTSCEDDIVSGTL